MPTETAPAVPPPNPFTLATCADCGETLARCRCYPHTTLRYNDAGPITFTGVPTARFPRYVGVEIECGTASAPRSFRPVHEVARTTGVQVHSDMSIHGFSLGLELVTAPARGAAAEHYIAEACSALQAVGATVNETCGLHVHVDARDFSPADMVRFAVLLSRVEKTLYSVVSRSRRGGNTRGANTFALPWGPGLVSGGVDDLSLSVEERYAALLVNLYGSVRTAEAYKASRSKHHSRYHGVSFNAHDIRGTLEFRLHHGTVNARKITMWSAVCSALVQYAKDHTDEEVAGIRGTPAEILEAVLTDCEVARWVRVRRRFFEDRDRARRGLPPRRASRPVVAPAPAMPPEEAPETTEEVGEARMAGARPGRRMNY